MKKNTIFSHVISVFFILILFLVSSCSNGISEKNKGGRVSFSIEKSQVLQLLESNGIEVPAVDPSRAVEFPTLKDGQKIYIKISLLGDYEQSQTIEIKDDVDVAFEEVPIGATIYAQAEIFISKDGGVNTFMTLFTGQSEPITVQEEVENSIEIKKIQNALEGFVFVRGGIKSSLDYPDSAVFANGRSIEIADMYVCNHKVLISEYNQLADTSVSGVGDSTITRVSWFDAIKYCNNLSKKEGLDPCYTINGENVVCDFNASGYRLPTEAEWEYVARGGADGKLSGVKRLNDSSIREWCWDWYTNMLTEDVSGAGPSTGLTRVIRGGNTGLYRVDRYFNAPAYSGDNPKVGFRLVRSVSPSTIKFVCVIRFNTNCETELKNITIQNGECISEPEPLEKTGYSFEGWYLAGADRTTDSAFDFATPLNQNTTLEAKWSPIKYTVKFDKGKSTDAENTIEDIQTTYDQEFELPENVFTAPTGMKFGGWALAADSEDRTYSDKESVKNLVTQADGTITLYAYWMDKDRCNIIYEIDDYDVTSIEPKTYLQSQDVKLPTLELDGYIFSGWFTTEEYEEGSEISGWSAGQKTSDVTVYAKWTPAIASYKVEHYQQNLDEGDEKTYTLKDTDNKQGKVGVLTAATARNYEGFTISQPTVTQQTIEVGDATVVKIYYDRNTITYTFDPDGGKWGESSDAVEVSGLFGAIVDKPEDPEKTGYVFDTWDEEVPERFGKDDLSFTATWEAGEGTAYKVEHYRAGLDGVFALFETVNKTGITGRTTSAEAKVYNGFTSKTFEQGTIAADGSTVVRIEYTRNEIEYTFNPGEGNWGGDSSAKHIKGLFESTLTPPAEPTRAGYSFTEWSSEVPATFGYTPISFTAGWEANDHTGYTVQHWLQKADASGYEQDDSETLYGTTDTATNAKSAIRLNTYTGFENPSESSVTEGIINGDETTVVKIYYDRATAYYTFFTEDEVPFADGDKEKMITGLYGAAVTAPEAPEDTGYTFVRWVQDLDNDPGTSEVPATFGTGTMLFYPIYKYDVTFNSNGGSAVTTQQILYKSTASAPSLPTKTNCTFGGWYTSTDNGVTLSDAAFNFGTQITEPVTLYAKWISAGVSVTVENPVDGDLEVTDSQSGDTVTLTIENYSSSKTYKWYVDGTEITSSTTGFTLGEGTLSINVATGSTRQLSNGTYVISLVQGMYSATVTVQITTLGSKPTANAVGDIVFADGSAEPYSSSLTLTNAQKQAAIGVIFYASTSSSDPLGAKKLMVGLKNTNSESTQTIKWATSGADGYQYNFTSIKSAPVDWDDANLATATIETGSDNDGSNNWSEICANVSDEDTAGNYPAWEWVNKYAENHGIPTGNYYDGWYMATLAETIELYKNKTNVNAAITLADGDILASAYWLGNQCGLDDSSAKLWALVGAFDSGNIAYNGKTNTYRVFAIHTY